MEPSEETSPLAGDNFLEVPTSNEAYEDEEEVKATFKPRFSPLPRRRSSVSSDDAESEAPSSVARKVSFADAFGLDLVSVKEFDTWEIPSTSQNHTFEDEVILVDEFYLLSRFEVPSREEVLQKVHTQNVLLEAIEFLPESASLSGIIRVLNVSFAKLVFVRMTLDDWLSYYDILAEYVPNSCDGETDQFSFRISLVPPYLKDGAKIEFCIRYETSAGTFWANNHGKNYQLSCHKKEAVVGADKESEDISDASKKSCLKTSQSKEEEILALGDEDAWDYSKLSDATIPQIVYPTEDDVEEIDESIDVKAMQHGRHNERELELLLSQHLIRIRDASSGDKGNLSVSEHNNFSSDEQRCEQELTLEDTNTDLRQNSLNVCGFLQDTLEEDDKPLAYDTHLEECYFGQPDDVPKITGSADDIQQYLHSSEVQNEGHFTESEQNKSFLFTDSVSDRQETSMGDVSKGDLETDSSCAIDEWLFINEDMKFTTSKAFKVRKDAISPEFIESEQSMEDLGDSGNTSTSPYTEDSTRITLGSLHADHANGQNKESTEIAQETSEGEIREHGLHTAALPRGSSWTATTEVFEPEKSLTPNATSASSNANGEQSQLEGSQLWAIKEQDSSSLLEIHVSNVIPEHIHQNDKESADMLSLPTDGKESLSVVNTFSQPDDHLMITPVADERSTKGFHELMSSARYEGNVAADQKTNKGQELISSVTEPSWEGEANELSNTLRETERKYPFFISSISTDIPVHCDSAFTAHGVHSSNSIAYSAETISFGNKEDQTMENVSSTETECENEGVSENMFFAKEAGERTVSTSFSSNVESEEEGLAENTPFARKDSKETFEISASEHLQSQSDETGDNICFVEEGDEKEIVTSSFKQRECEKEGVAENMSFATIAGEKTIEFSQFEHEKLQNKEAKEDILFVEKGDEKDIVISPSEHVESEEEGLALNISFARIDNKETFEIIAFEYLQSENKEAGEDISFVKEDNDKGGMTSYFKHRECEKEGVEENISFLRPYDEETFEFLASNRIGSQKEGPKEDISFVKEGDEKVVVISSSEHIESEIEVVAENTSFAGEDDEEPVNITTSQHIKSQNKDAEKDTYLIREHDEKNVVISYSEHKESDKEVLVKSASFVREHNEATITFPAFQNRESENEEEEEDIPFAKEVGENNIDNLLSEPVHRANAGGEENIYFAREHNEKTVQILASENIEIQNKEAKKDMSLGKETVKKTTAKACSEQIESKNADLEKIMFCDKNNEEDIETLATKHIGSQHEEVEDISIVKENGKKDFVNSFSEQRESEREGVSERNGDEDNNEISVSEHTECEKEEAEHISVAKEDDTKDIVTASSEYTESETEVSEENTSFVRLDNEEALEISTSKVTESDFAEAKEHIGCQNIVLSTKLGLPQLESLSMCVGSEQPENMKCSDSHRTEKVNILDIEAVETDYSANEAEITNKESKSQEMCAGTQGRLQIGSLEELYISQETVSVDDYVLVDPNIGDQVKACRFPLNETLSEGTLENLYEGVKEKCNETVESEIPTVDGTFIAVQEAKIGRFLNVHNDNISISSSNEDEDSLKVHVEETLQRDSVSSVEVQQNTTEFTMPSISLKDETTWPVLTKEVAFQQKLYIEKSPEQQQHDLEKPASEGNSIPSYSDINLHQKISSVNVSEECNLSIVNLPELSSLDTRELSKNRDFPQSGTRQEATLGPVILASEATDERGEMHSGSEEQLAPTIVLQLQGDKHQMLHSESVSDPKNVVTGLSNESIILKRISYKVLHFLLFVVFAFIIYQCDSLLCSVLCVCSLYWLFFERGTHKESVKKQ